MNRDYKPDIIRVVQNSRKALQPNRIVAGVVRLDPSMDRDGVYLAREAVDTMIMNGELVYNKKYTGLRLPKPR